MYFVQDMDMEMLYGQCMKRMALSVPIDNSEDELNHIEEWTNNAGREEMSVLADTVQALERGMCFGECSV